MDLKDSLEKFKIKLIKPMQTLRMLCLATRQAILHARNKINSTPKTPNSLDEKLELIPNDLKYTIVFLILKKCICIDRCPGVPL